MKGFNGSTAKLLLIGLAAMVLYSQFGPLGLIAGGLFLMMAS